MRTLSNDELTHISGSGVDASMFNGLGTALISVLVLTAILAAAAGGTITYFFSSRKEKETV